MTERTKTKITIKNRWTGAIIFESTKTTVKEAVIEAVAQEKDLSGSNLSGSNLSYSDLRGSFLIGADGDKLSITSSNVLLFSGFGSACRATTAFLTEKGIFVNCGCYEGLIKDFKAQVKKTHGNNQYAKEYLQMCKLIESRFKV